MRARRRLVLATLTTMAALPVAAGCATQAAEPATKPIAAKPVTAKPVTAKPVTAKPVAAVATAFGVTDRAWIEVNIAMDEQLRPLLALAPGRAADPAVQALAGQVRAFVDTELSTLRLLHDRAGLPAQNPHEGMLMPGMVTSADVTEAATLHGTEFDALTVEKVKEYLAQGVNLAQSETRYGTDPRTTALAADGLSARNRMLSSLPG